MLRLSRVSWAFAIAITGVGATAVDCGGGVSTTGGQGGTTSASSSSSSASSSSTAASSSSTSGGGAAPCPSKMGTTLALTKIDLGPGNNGQWKKIGLNIDGLVSTAASTDVCQPNAGGSKSTAYPDGDNGIDNSFGKNLLPLILALDPTWHEDVNSLLTMGNFNAMLKMYCLPPKGDAKITTKLFGGTSLGSVPVFDGTDKWPVAPELLLDPKDPESSSITFADSTVTGDKYDSGKGQTVILTLPLSFNNMSTNIKLTLHAAQVIMNLSADRKSATGGVIGGVLNTEEFLDQVKKIGWVYSLCGMAEFDNAIKIARQASDIMTDGTQDPKKTCDGISIGIAFEMKEVQIGDVGPAAPAGMACP